MLGGLVEDDAYTTEGEHSGFWWTETADLNYGYVRAITPWGRSAFVKMNHRVVGARPVLPYSSISSVASNKVRKQNGILEVEYGEYPQTVVPKGFAGTLERAYFNGTLNQTGKCYTTDSVSCQDEDIPFQARIHTEYEYNGKKYIRIFGNEDNSKKILSDSGVVRLNETYWVEVEPIIWMIDERTDIALSKKIIFSGVQFIYDNYYSGNFDETDIKEFMDDYFSKEIMSSYSGSYIPSSSGSYIPSSSGSYNPSSSRSYNPSCSGSYTPSSSRSYNPSCSGSYTQSYSGIITPEDNDQIGANNVINVGKQSNPYGFDFEEVSEEDIIRGAIESGVAVFLHGKSSEGKSARVKQIDPECVIIYLRNATPESLNGKSVYNAATGEMIDIKPTWLKKIEERCEKEPDKYHIVFLDEITNALPSIQGIAFNIVLDREVNGIWELPKNARIVAAGNDMADSLAANQLAEPLFNRFAHVYIETSVENWLKWASEHNIHPAIYAYIAYTKGGALRSDYDGERPNADPRKWEMASKMLYATGKPEMLRSLVGEDITREFCQFCNQKVITLDDVINGNYIARDLQMNTSEIYATTFGLSQVDEENFAKVREFVSRLGGEPCALFDSLWTHGDEARMEMVAEARLANNRGGRRRY